MTSRIPVVLVLFFLLMLTGPAFGVMQGFITMQDGYFYDSGTGQPWVPHGIAYQTWNRPLGVWQTYDQIDYDLDEMKKMGANSIRVDFVWQHIEEKGDNIWSWTNYDYLVQACEKRDMRMFALVGYQWPPNWFPDSYYTMHPPGYDNEGIMHTNRWQSDIINYENPLARAQYSNFLYTVCSRYKNSKAIAGWIVGNEYGYLGLWSLKYDGYDTNCETAFRTWCTQKYTQITNLNAKWGSAYTSFSAIVLSDTYEWKGPKGALWSDMVQWHEDSIAGFTAAGARAARVGDTNHLLSYSTVGMQWGEEDWRYHAEDRGKIARACASNNAALGFFSINNYPWAMDGSETRNGQWGISFTKKTANMPVLYTETGFTSSETLFPGVTLDRQGILIRNALWESLEAGAVGTHVFTWQDRPWITDREKGFGILYGDRNIKPAFWTTRDTFNLMDQVGISDLLKGSQDPKPDVAFLWDDATDSQYVRFENEMQHEAGALERLGFEPTFMLGLGELSSGAYTNYKAIILPRNMRVSDTVPGYTNSVLNFMVTQVLPKGIHVIAVADLPGMQDRWGKPRAAFSNEMTQLFGIDASDVGGVQPPGLMDDSILRQYYHKIAVRYNTNAPAGLANYAHSPTIWKCNDRVRVNGNGGTLWAVMDSGTNRGYEASATNLWGWNTWGVNEVRQWGWQYEGTNMVRLVGWAGHWQNFIAIPGQKYTADAYLRSNSDDGLSNGTYGVVAIEWYDSTGTNVISTAESARLTAANNAWQYFSVSSIAPSNVSFGRIVRKLDRPGVTPIGSLYVDADTFKPAVVAKSHGAGKAVIVLYSLDMLPDGNGDGEPDNLPYQWRYDILGGVLKDYCGLQPAIKAIGANGYLCLPEYRTCTNGAILMQIKNYLYDRYAQGGGSPQTYTIQSSLVTGKTIRAFEQGRIIEENSDGSFNITLAPDGQEILYAYGQGTVVSDPGDPTSSDDTMFRGRNDRSGSLKSGPAAFPLQGQWTNSSLSYPTTPIVAFDKLYVVDNYFRNTMRCIDPRTGSILWSSMIGGGEYFNPWSIAAANGTIFCTTKNNYGAPTGAVYAIDAFTGSIKWKKESVSINCTPVCVRDNIVYYGGAGDYIHAVTADTGAPVWTSTNNPSASHYTPLVLASNKVILCHGSIYAFDSANGSLKWGPIGVRSGWCESAPAVANGRIYIPRNDGGQGVLVLDLNTGATLWQNMGFYCTYKFGAPAVANGKMYVVGRSVADTNAYLYCFNANASNGPLWTCYLGATADDVSPVVVSNVVYVGGSVVRAINANTGAVLWNFTPASNGSYDPFTKYGWMFYCDGYRLYGFSDGSPWPTSSGGSSNQICQITDAPSVVHPMGDKSYGIRVKYDCNGKNGLQVKVAFMEAGDNGDGVTNEIYQVLSASAYGASEAAFWMWIPDPNQKDPDYKSTPDGGNYHFVAWLEDATNNRPAISKPFPTRLEWGIRPTNAVPASVTKGQVLTMPLEWEDVYEYLWWQNTPLARNDAFPSRVALFRSSKTEAQFPGHFTKVNAVADWLQSLGYSAGNPLDISFDNVTVVNGTTFKDDFEDGNYTGWTRAAGCANWIVTQSITGSTTGVRGWWKMDEASWTGGVNQAADSSGYACHGTPYGGAKTTNVMISGRAGWFDGSNDYVEVTNRPVLQACSNLTLSFWIRGSNLGSKRVNPIDKNYGGEFALTIETNRSLNFYHGYSRTSGQYLGWAALPANSLTNNAWSHVVITRTRSTRSLKSYLNGVLKSSYTYATNLQPAASAYPIRIGLGYTGLGFGGMLDEVKVSTSAWTTNDVMKEYTYGVNRQALRAWRIGNSDNIMTYANTYTNATISADIRYNRQDPYFNDAELYFRYQNRDNFYKVGIRNYYGFWRLRYMVRAGTNIQQQGWLYDFPKTSAPTSNTWYNLKVQSYGSTNKVYFNNVLVGTFWATNFASGKVGVGASAMQLGIWEPQKGYFFVDDDEYSFWAPEGQSQLSGHPLNLDWGYLVGFFPTLVLPSTYVMSDLEVSNVCTWVTNGMRSLIATDGSIAMRNETGASDAGRIESLFGVATPQTNLALVSRVILRTNDHYVTLDYGPGTQITAGGASKPWQLVNGGLALGSITNGGLRPALIANILAANTNAPSKAFCFNFGVDYSTLLTGNFKSIAKRAFEWTRGEAYKVRVELKYQLNPTNQNLDLTILSTNVWVFAGTGTSNLQIRIPSDGIMTGTNLYWVMYCYPWDATNAWTSHMGFYSSGNESNYVTIAGMGLQILGIANYAYAGRDWDLWLAYNAQTQTASMVYGVKEKGTLSDEDNFNDGNYTGWTVITNNNVRWTVTNNALRATVVSTGGYSYITRSGLALTTQNITMEYDVCFSNNASTAGGLTYRGRVCYVNPQLCGWADNTPNYVTNGTGIVNGKWHHIVLNVRSGSPYSMSDLYVDGLPVFVSEPIQVTSYTTNTIGFLSPYSPSGSFVQVDNYRLADEQYSFTLTNNVSGQYVPTSTNPVQWATVPDYDPDWWEYDGTAYGGNYQWFVYFRDGGAHSYQGVALYFSPRLMVEATNFPKTLAIGQTVNVPIDWENLDKVPVRMGLYLQDAKTGCRYVESNFTVSVASGSGAYPITIPAGLPPGTNYSWVTYMYPTNASEPQGQRLGRDDTFRFDRRGYGVEPETVIRVNSTGGSYVAYADIGIPMDASAFSWGGNQDGNYTNGAPEGVKYWKTGIPYVYGGWGIFHPKYMLDLSQYGYLKFWVKSRRPIKVEIEAPQNTKRTVDLCSNWWNPAQTNWQEVTIPIASFGFGRPLTNVYGSFEVTMLSPRVRAISFLSTNVGFAVGTMYDGGRYVNVSSVQKTSGNGATNWSTVVPGTNYEIATFHDVDFVDANNGWIAANSKGILRTVNGGTTWTPATNGINGSSIVSLDFVSSTTGWALDSNYKRIFKTTDGGATWVQQLAVTNTYLSMSKIRFLDANNGWAVGGYYYNTGKVFRTSNGGATWTEVSVGYGYMYDVQFLDSLNGFICGETGQVFKTVNGGASWTPIHVPSSYSLYSICWLNSQTGWAGAGNGNLFRTVNGGASWSSVWAGYYGDAMDIQVLDGTTMFIALDTPYNTPGVLKSTNINDSYPSFTRMDGDANQFSIDNVRWSLTP